MEAFWNYLQRKGKAFPFYFWEIFKNTYVVEQVRRAASLNIPLFNK